MGGLTAPDLLTVWETGRSARRLEQPLAALCAWIPERSREEFARMSLGDRDELLLELHAATFGPHIEGIASCPYCAGAVEFGIPVSDLPGGDHEPSPPHRFIELDGYVLDCRLPDTEDLLAASAAQDSDQARELIVRRCIAVQSAPEPSTADELPEHVVAVVADELAAMQPGSDIEIGLHCPTCAAVWNACLDVGTFVWEEVAVEARRLVYEVDRLARAYGWRESDILSMTPARRRSYLALVE
jgi:hypothetical protein